MFICSGENDNEREAVGTGETIEAAVCDWASEDQLIFAIAQFNKWGPDIYEGNKIKVQFNCTISKA